jgi:hypothetical protein
MAPCVTMKPKGTTNFLAQILIIHRSPSQGSTSVTYHHSQNLRTSPRTSARDVHAQSRIPTFHGMEAQIPSRVHHY